MQSSTNNEYDYLFVPRINILELIEDIDVVGDHIVSVAVHSSTPIKLKISILAAIKTYLLQNKSIDYVLKRYGSIWEAAYNEKKSEPFDFIREAGKLVRVMYKKVDQIDHIVSDDISGHFVAHASLHRLHASFSSLMLLIRCGLYFEAMSISRLIFEQLSFAFNAHDLSDGKHIDVPPSKTINKFKKIIPNAGKIYGFLSDAAHITPPLNIAQYLSFKDDVTKVIMCFGVSHTLNYIFIMLVDLYCIILEYIHSSLIESPECIIKEENGNIIFNDKRPALMLQKQYEERYEE